MRATITMAAALAATLVVAAPLAAQTAPPGAVKQSGAAAVPQNQKPSPLALTDDQRAKIKQALTSKDTEETKGAKDFVPAVGAKLPKGVKPHGLPTTLVSEIPVLKQYAYAKMKRQIAIVDATSDKIVELIPEI